MTIFKHRGVNLEEFVRGIVKALTGGQQAIPQAREEFLHCHMEEVERDGETVHKPKTFTVQVADNPARYVTVPTYTMSQVNTIGISSAKIRCSARIVDMETETKNGHVAGHMSCGDRHAVFNVHPSQGSKNSFEMELEFHQREPSESESRLIESLDSVVFETVEN